MDCAIIANKLRRRQQIGRAFTPEQRCGAGTTVAVPGRGRRLPARSRPTPPGPRNPGRRARPWHDLAPADHRVARALLAPHLERSLEEASSPIQSVITRTSAACRNPVFMNRSSWPALRANARIEVKRVPVLRAADLQEQAPRGYVEREPRQLIANGYVIPVKLFSLQPSTTNVYLLRRPVRQQRVCE